MFPDRPLDSVCGRISVQSPYCGISACITLLMALGLRGASGRPFAGPSFRSIQRIEKMGAGRGSVFAACIGSSGMVTGAEGLPPGTPQQLVAG